MDEAAYEGLSIYKVFMDAIGTLTRESSTLEELRFRLDEFLLPEFLVESQQSFQDSMEVGNALGRSLLVEVNQALSADEVAGTEDDIDWIACADLVRIAFDLIPEEALEFLRYRAFTIAGVEHDELVEAVRGQVLEALEKGRSIREFRRNLGLLFDSFGVTRLSDLHLKTVYRTNLFSAYAVGQLEQAISMRDRFPLWRYSAILDNRTRLSHRDLNGRIFRTGEGPLPPIDFNCRCTAIYVHKSQAEGLQPEVWVDTGGLVKLKTIGGFKKWASSRRPQLKPATREWIEAQSARVSEK